MSLSPEARPGEGVFQGFPFLEWWDVQPLTLPYAPSQPWDQVEQRKTNNTNLRQDPGRRQKLKERSNRVRMAKGLCGSRREKKQEVLDGS